MFRMNFQSRDTADEDEDSCADGKNNGSVQERYRERFGESVSYSPEAEPPTVVFEGRVGKFGRIQRLSSSNKATHPAAHHASSSLRSLILSPNVATTGSKYCADVDLSNFKGPAQDAELPHYAAIIFDVDVLKELVKPFAESLHIKIQGSTKESLADKKIIVSYIHYQTSAVIKRQDVEKGSVSSPTQAALLEARTDFMPSASSDADSECCSSYMDEGKPMCDKENEAVTGMIGKLMEKRKNKIQLNGHDDRLAKPWEEPLLAAHDQAKLNLMARKEAKIEAKRLAEEEQRHRERQQRELQDLANCVSIAPKPGGSSRKRKLKKILRYLKNPFRVFRSQKIKHGGYPIAREAKVMIPNPRLFSGSHTVPSGFTDSALASMRNASQQSITRANFQFAKVNSTQRDVPAWTREEYLRKNGRIPEPSNDSKDDEEFGGVLGNNYLNQYLDDCMAGGVLSDYDSDSD